MLQPVRSPVAKSPFTSCALAMDAASTASPPTNRNAVKTMSFAFIRQRQTQEKYRRHPRQSRAHQAWAYCAPLPGDCKPDFEPDPWRDPRTHGACDAGGDRRHQGPAARQGCAELNGLVRRLTTPLQRWLKLSHVKRVSDRRLAAGTSSTVALGVSGTGCLYDASASVARARVWSVLTISAA